MPRPKSTDRRKVRSELVALRLSPEEVEALDEKRGEMSRSEYIRRALDADGGDR